jgi:RNA polymerase sigma-70 factor (ECF subfamily)
VDEIETLYRQHASALFRFAWGLSGNRSEAEDLVSETFVRVLTRVPRVETQTALAYLLAVVRNTYLSRLRRRKQELPLLAEIHAPAWDPVSRLDEQVRLESVMEALRHLPEGERAALLLRVDHDLSYEEIAAALGTTVGAARLRVHRARVRLAGAAIANAKGR